MHHLPTSPTAPLHPSTPNAEPQLAAFSAWQARRVLVRLFRPPELFDPAPQQPSRPPVALPPPAQLADRLSGLRSPSPDSLPVYTPDPSAGEQVLDHNSRRRRRRAVTESYALEQERRRELQQQQRGRPGMRRRGYSVENVFFAATLTEGMELGDEGDRVPISMEAVEGGEAVVPRKISTRVFVLPLYEAEVVVEEGVQKASRPTIGKRKWSWAGGMRSREMSVGVQVQ